MPKATEADSQFNGTGLGAIPNNKGPYSHTPAEWKRLSLSCFDPYVQQVTKSIGIGVVFGAKAFPGGNPHFKRAWWNGPVNYCWGTIYEN